MHLKPTVYRGLTDILSRLHPTREEVMQILLKADIPPEKTNLNGSAVLIWDSALAYAESVGLVEALAHAGLENVTTQEAASLLDSLRSGEAFFDMRSSYAIFKRNTEKSPKTNVFLIRSEEDQEELVGLLGHLNIAKLAGIIEIDYLTDAGANISESIIVKISKAEIILAAISPKFFLDQRPLELTFAAFDMNKRVVPILLSNCPYARIKRLKDIQPLPRSLQFLTDLRMERNKVEAEVAEELTQLAEKLNANKS